MKQFSLIMASSWNSVVGSNNSLPWKCSRDMKRFKELTAGQIVVMGKGTWDSLGRKPLKDRVNVIVSKELFFDKKDSGFFVCPDLESVHYLLGLTMSIEDKEFFLIGGAKLAKAAMEKNLVNKLYMTTVCGYIHGDIYFHPFNYPQKWKPTYASSIGKDENDSHSTIFFNYELKENDDIFVD